MSSARDWIVLAKVRIQLLSTPAAVVCAWIAAEDSFSLAMAAHLGVGLTLVSSASSAINQVLEVDVDAAMQRTRGRPLPAGRMEAPHSDFAALTDGAGLPAGLSLLIVEDNAVNMMIVAALLDQWGVQVAEASNGADAVARVHARADAGQPFDLVLMDLQMPVQGGHDATRALRERFDARALPIIALTAAALTSERDEALAAGMNDFLTKPIDAQRLHEALRRWGPQASRVAP